MKDALNLILGPYTPDLTAEGLAQVDWPWIAGAILVIVSVYCIFKFVGGIFRAK